MSERQPYSTFKAINVAPNNTTDLKLSGGVTIPYVYSVGVETTVPFVRFIGSSIGQKVFSWAEKIVVPPGEMVTVANASNHPGDISIQSGWDPAAIPARVTVPVPLQIDAGGLSISGQFPADVRRARRAYVAGFESVPDLSPGLQITVTGKAVGRSHLVAPALSYTLIPEPQYQNVYTYPPSTDVGLIPLGDKARLLDGAHALLTTAEFSINNVSETTSSGSVYYVLEYV